jgi:hypothetical protein
VVFIPEPTKEVFPKLHEALSKIEEAKELFNLDYQSLRLILWRKVRGRLRLKDWR